jgi:Zn-dependent peptidase ImmA (M78 family)
MREFNAAWEQFKLLPTRVERLAAAFRVSGRVVVRRALELGKVSRTEFYDMMDAAKAREQPRLKRKGGNPDTNLAARNSTILIDKVVRAVHRNHIEYRDAGRVLGVSVDTISKLAKR